MKENEIEQDMQELLNKLLDEDEIEFLSEIVRNQGNLVKKEEEKNV